jgi:DNA-binding beta-propeller fold protein YncE
MLKMSLLVFVCAIAVCGQEGWYPHEGGPLGFRAQPRFGLEPETMPPGWQFGRVSAVASDSSGNVYAFQRGPHADPLIVFDSKGKFLRSWGKGLFGTPHGVRVDSADFVWITDSSDHQVMKFNRNGELLLTLGTKGKAGTDEHTFNRPTDIAFAPNSDFYVSDGYGNSRIVKFAKDGKYLAAWGKKGAGPGEFSTPHSVAVDSSGRVYVCDRDNNRVQIFNADGKFLRQWTHLGCALSMSITAKDDAWVLAHRSNVEGSADDWLAGRILHVDLATGKILGSVESPGHWISASAAGEIFVGSLTGNVIRWYPAQ